MNSDNIIRVIKKHTDSFLPIVPFKPGKDKLLRLDFTGNNVDLKDEIFNDTRQFTNYINNKLSSTGATYGIGGYNELRTVYSRSHFFDADQPGEEPRRLHLGIDIWGKPYTPVKAPLYGVVHSFGMNEGLGNYGVTIILTHKIDDISFHTLYGHLSLSSIRNLEEGVHIRPGDVFAEFGIPSENGQWPPHLHFQLINDLEGHHADYPGVCKYSEREKYLENCPDPDLMLNMMQYVN